MWFAVSVVLGALLLLLGIFNIVVVGIFIKKYRKSKYMGYALMIVVHSLCDRVILYTTGVYSSRPFVKSCIATGTLTMSK